MNVRDVIVKKPVTLPADATLTEAAQAVGRESVGAVIIVEEPATSGHRD